MSCVYCNEKSCPMEHDLLEEHMKKVMTARILSDMDNEENWETVPSPQYSEVDSDEEFGPPYDQYYEEGSYCFCYSCLTICLHQLVPPPFAFNAEGFDTMACTTCGLYRLTAKFQ